MTEAAIRYTQRLLGLPKLELTDEDRARIEAIAKARGISPEQALAQVIKAGIEERSDESGDR